MMKQLKYLLATVLALCLIFSLCACGGADSNGTTAGTTTAATTLPEQSQDTTAPVDDGRVVYRVTLVDEDGNPLTGAIVQLCSEVCIPAGVDESGVAQFSLAEADYKVSFLKLPEGYTYSTEEQEFHFAPGSTELTITLKAEN